MTMRRRTSRELPSRGRDADQLERARKALNHIDKLLSQAEDLIGSSLSSVSFRENYPRAHKAADDAFNHIEAARRALAYRR